jgi:phospholipid/cholesterol/gamma-HCH transport system substrate-binding protein
VTRSHTGGPRETALKAGDRMPGQASKFKIGLFVVVSILIGMVMLIWLGTTRFFSPSRKVAVYFSESVQGLEEDSPVKFRGVTIGRVYSIRMAPDAKHVEVVMALNRDFKISDDLGVRADHLGLTGMKYLEMDRYGKGRRREPEPLDFKPDFPRITAYPSELRQIGNEVGDLFRKVKAVDMKEISRHLLNVSAKLDRMMSDPKVDNIAVDAAEAVKQLKEAATKLNREVDKIKAAKRITRTLDNSVELLQELRKAAMSADQLIHRTDNNINRISRKIDRAADNLVDFSDRLQTEPIRALFRGKSEESK